MKKRDALVVLLFCVILRGDGCGTEDVLQNPGFDLWCGDALCHWNVVDGEIERVPTWHRSDWGASLVGDRVVLEQAVPLGDEFISCIEITAQTVIERGATLRLELDDDTHIDLPNTDFHDHHQTVDFAPLRTTMFILVKTGEATAIVAQVRAQVPPTCRQAPSPSGSPCWEGQDCLNSVCTDGVCE